MKMNLILGVMALACAPSAIGRGNADYPSEKVAAFVVEKLDATSLPPAMRPKKEKGKKTLADYGYAAQKVEEDEAIVEAAGEGRRLSFKVLDHKPSSGIYACVSMVGQNGDETKLQSVVLLRRKGPNALLKSRESLREFASCPVIGGDDSTANSY